LDFLLDCDGDWKTFPLKNCWNHRENYRTDDECNYREIEMISDGWKSTVNVRFSKLFAFRDNLLLKIQITVVFKSKVPNFVCQNMSLNSKNVYLEKKL
jgi:hypothetical protein